MARVVISGAGQGLGRALTVGYLRRGCEVWAGCRVPERASGLADHGACVCRLDVADASKVALNAVTVRTARLLAGTGVIVVAIHPGWVRTNMGGPEATLSPEEAAHQLMQTVDALTVEHSGMFLDQNGTTHPW